MLLLLGPGFVASPGLVQKAFGSESVRALQNRPRRGRSRAAGYSFLPVLLGMAARVHHPDLANANLVLPTVVMTELPVWIGGLALAAMFSAEVSTCDAILFMLSTSISQDVYQRFQPCSVARRRAARRADRGHRRRHGGDVPGDPARDRGRRLSIFYSMLSPRCSYRSPAVWWAAGRRARGHERDRRRGRHAARRVFLHGSPGWWDPGTWGLLGSAVGFGSDVNNRSRRNRARNHGDFSPGGQASMVLTCVKPAATNSSITTAGGTPCPPRFAGTPAGKGDPLSGAASMIASQPPGLSDASRLLLNAGIAVTW